MQLQDKRTRSWRLLQNEWWASQALRLLKRHSRSAALPNAHMRHERVSWWVT